MSNRQITWANLPVGVGHGQGLAYRGPSGLGGFSSSVPRRHRYKLCRDNIRGVNNPRSELTSHHHLLPFPPFPPFPLPLPLPLPVSLLLLSRLIFIFIFTFTNLSSMSRALLSLASNPALNKPGSTLALLAGSAAKTGAPALATAQLDCLLQQGGAHALSAVFLAHRPCADDRLDLRGCVGSIRSSIRSSSTAAVITPMALLPPTTTAAAAAPLHTTTRIHHTGKHQRGNDLVSEPRHQHLHLIVIMTIIVPISAQPAPRPHPLSASTRYTATIHLTVSSAAMVTPATVTVYGVSSSPLLRRARSSF
ncbi:hypothetical protein EPUS_07475 [Endocarpon pusillum Z07020]|uniref:Uncharacterized protein n=1 Tax=Endocarpon pusillum (strain Z07020 / HMAS-L-300199) TaxID=1263415 RepID=U1G5T0_ENDPU|nr:uncharacterized protein EPUS_07475 [Endocarpon pusillum Z07020]ERF72682.1 hypothetical protein EPUS_07475 [Endocarpon pusillum Z07020]